MKRTGRLVAAAGALLVLVGGAGPADAAVRAQARNPTAQATTSAYWGLVVQAGTAPAATAGPPMTYSSLGTFYAVLTNLGTVKPGSLRMLPAGGLTVVSLLEACTTQWTPQGACPGTSERYVLSTTAAITDQSSIPGPGVTWWLKISTVATVGATLSANTTGPAGSTSAS